MLNYEIISHDKALPIFINYYSAENSLVPGHWHNHLEILYIDQGKMDLQLDDRAYNLTAGDIFIVNSGSIHQTWIKSKSTILLLQIPDSLISRSLPNTGFIFFENYLPVSTANKKLVKILQEMKESYLEKKFAYIFRFNSLLQEFLFRLVTHHSYEEKIKTELNKHHPKLQKVLKYMTENYYEPLTVTELAALLDFHPDYFCRFFKKHIGSTFLDYLNLIRLSHIHADLLKSNDTITAIQNRHGFTNYKVFNREFRKLYGCAPSQVKKR